ncbi:MAG: hypothetical protein ACYS9T_00500 [Planctomycetota bacterium]|jgi:hypothetical protein
MSERTNVNIWVVTAGFLLAVWCATASAQTIYIDVNATVGNAEFNWTGAGNINADPLFVDASSPGSGGWSAHPSIRPRTYIADQEAKQVRRY